MINKSSKLIILLLVSITSILVAAEERPHSVLEQHGPIEIRQYDSIMAAEVTMTGDRSDAANAAFRRLFSYIQGKNTSKQKIAMTTPVSQLETDANEWQVRFFLPQSVTKELAPSSTDQRVRIVPLKPVKVAAIRFSGRAKQSQLDEQESILRAFLKDKHISYIDNPIYAFYNAPFVPWFLRRNEVLFEIKEKENT